MGARGVSLDPKAHVVAAALRKRPLFVSASAGQIAWLAERATHRRLADGERLYEVGDRAAAICVLLSGDLGRMQDGEEVDDIRPVRAFDEVVALRGAIHDSAMVADAPSVLAIIDRAHIDALLEQEASFRRAVRAANRVPAVIRAATERVESEHADVLSLTGVEGPRRSNLWVLLADGLRGYGERVTIVDSSTDPGTFDGQRIERRHSGRRVRRPLWPEGGGPARHRRRLATHARGHDEHGQHLVPQAQLQRLLRGS